MEAFNAANKTEKVSDRIINQIRQAALAGRLRPGDRLGSEKELTSQFGVSKATMREALRVLESMGLVEIRKGIQGGVFLVEVDVRTTIQGIINFLHFREVSVREITMLRYFLEPAAAQMAAVCITPEEIARLRSLAGRDQAEGRAKVADDIAFHRYLVRISQNPMMTLVMDFVEALLHDIKKNLTLDDEFFRAVRKRHLRILDCLARRDAAGARREIIADILEVGRRLAELTGSRCFDPAEMHFSEGAGEPPDAAAPAPIPDPGGPGGMQPALPPLIDLGNLTDNTVFRHEESGRRFMLTPIDET